MPLPDVELNFEISLVTVIKNLYRTKAHMQMIRKMRTKGLILFESLPSLFIASRMQARSTTAGTPVKSCGEERCSKE